MDNAPYSQHLEDEEHDDVQDASGRGARQGKVYEGGEVGRSAKKDEGVGRNGDVYKGGGVGLSVKMEDKGAGRNDDVDKDEGAGRSAKIEDALTSPRPDRQSAPGDRQGGNAYIAKAGATSPRPDRVVVSATSTSPRLDRPALIANA